MPSRPGSFRDEVGINCPHCGKSQLPPNRVSIDTWTCTHCYSGFVSIALLTNLIPKDLVAKIVARRLSYDSGRPCPMCKSPLELADVREEDRELTIDLCRTCNIVWFDAGRIVQLVRLRSPQEIIAQIDRVKKALERLEPPRGPSRQGQAQSAEPINPSPPWITMGIFISCGALTPLAIYRPDIVAKLSFVPGAPLRALLITWLTSLFFNPGGQMYTLLGFVVVGAFVERHIGSLAFLQLFLVTGLAGRLAYWLGGPALPPVLGTAPAFSGVLAYAILIFPYRETFFPSERWKSSLGTVMWFVVAGFAFVAIHVAWDYYLNALGGVASGNVSSLPSASLLSRFMDLLAQPHFRSHFVSGAIGLLWYIRHAAIDATHQP